MKDSPAVDRGTTYSDLVRLAVERTARAPAFVFNGACWSRQKLRDEVSGFCEALLARGFKRGDGGVVVARNDPSVFAAAAAIQILGGCFTPLSTYSPLSEKRSVLGNSKAKWLLHNEAGAGEAEELCRDGLCKPLSFGDIRPSVHPLPMVDVTSEELAVIAYTGGTTGKAKGVMLSQRAVATSMQLIMSEWPWCENSRFLICGPISHASGSLIVPTLMKGGTIFLHDGFDADQVLKAIADQGITHLIAVPTMIYSMLDRMGDIAYRPNELQAFIYGSAPIDPSRLRQAMAAFGPVFFQHYGQTEAPMTLTMLRKEDHLDDEAHSTCGVAAWGAHLRIVKENGEVALTGEVGELRARGPLVMSGYWERPDETRDAFDDEGWLRTGDLGRKDEKGYISIVGRSKDMIISGGFNLYPKEIEEVLAEVSGIAQACIVGVPDDHWGEIAVAVIMPKPNCAVNEKEISKLIKERKGPIFCPKRYLFVNDMPKTDLGKIDRNRIRALALEEV